jgi:indolepyruvate ferredoxin oxidoreductase, alpha subunit
LPNKKTQVEGARLLLGNEAIALGLWEAGCRVACAYPGTPSTEVMESLAKMKAGSSAEASAKAEDLHLEWSINEKVAVEVASAASFSGLRSAAVMKQVGLNVAMDPLMSLAYTGVAGGMVLVVADDPGPFSSQTEQDTRTFAMAAGVPVLDPMTPEEAREMVSLAYDISERYRTPVILRPVLRVCHSRAPVSPARARRAGGAPEFRREPSRWAATPKFRYALHLERDAKLAAMAKDPLLAGTTRFLFPLAQAASPEGRRRLAIVASGAAAAYAADLLTELGLTGTVPLLAVGAPYPLDAAAVAEKLAGCDKVLVLEETEPVLERQLRGLLPLRGREDGTIPAAGEMTPDIVAAALARLLPSSSCPPALARHLPGPLADPPADSSDVASAKAEAAKPAPPTLCAGCPHRASFWALRKALPRGIYAGDIGCYTLGIALGAVDTCLCMGASIAQASGFYWAHRSLGDKAPPVAATIGDSTFFHSGAAPLANAVNQGAAFVLLILDNALTAMTGGQPTPATGALAGGGEGVRLSLEKLVEGCGVKRLAVVDALDPAALLVVLREAAAAAKGGEMAVVISRSPCVLSLRERQGAAPTVDRDKCNRCRICVERFGCPALSLGPEGAIIDEAACPGCGACVAVCPQGAITHV